MSQEERFGTRDGTYSAWHRRKSTRRFVGEEIAEQLAMIDLDGALFIEADNDTKTPLVLMEVAIDIGQGINGKPDKSATIIRKLAEMANIGGLLVLYTPL